MQLQILIMNISIRIIFLITIAYVTSKCEVDGISLLKVLT